MLFAVRFTDKPGSRLLRERNLAAHLAWLSERNQQILVAGSLREETGSNPVAGLWIVEADSKEEVEALYQSDPFWTSGLRASVEIWHWSKAFPDKKAPV